MSCKSGKPSTHNISNKNKLEWYNPSSSNISTLGDLGPLDCQLIITRSVDTTNWSPICQVRIQYERVTLAQPTNGECLTDWLSITDGNGQQVSKTCGITADDKVYIDNVLTPQYFHAFVDFGDNPNATIKLAIKTGAPMFVRKWKLTIKAIKCNSIESGNQILSRRRQSTN